MSKLRNMNLVINGRSREVAVAANETLLETLRGIGAIEVKCGCEKGDCGACAVLLDRLAVDSCLTLTWTVGERAVTTVKGLGTVDNPHPLAKGVCRPRRSSVRLLHAGLDHRLEIDAGQ